MANIIRYLRSIMARLRAWRAGTSSETVAEPAVILSFGASLHRDVTPNGVKFYSLCGGCGARMNCSATLCEECARGPHASPF
jgi:hypothetical protein